MTTANEPDRQEPQSSHDAMLQQLLADPVGVIQQLVVAVTRQELDRFRQEMTFQSLMDRARQKYPELEAFESLLLKAMIDILEADPETETDSWDTILNKSVAKLRESMSASLMNQPTQTNAVSILAPQMERTSVRHPQPTPKRYSRQAIAKMTLAEFLRNEKDIEAALHENRID